MEKSLRKLTEDEIQKITSVLNEFFLAYPSVEPSEDEYITEYDIFMKKKKQNLN